MSTSLNLRGLSHSHGTRSWKCLDTVVSWIHVRKGTFTAKGAKEENLTTDNTDWTDFHG
jgi:hypothetical protein